MVKKEKIINIFEQHINNLKVELETEEELLKRS